MRSARNHFAGGLTNTKNTIQSVPSLVGGGIKNTVQASSGLLKGGIQNTKNAAYLIAGAAKDTKNVASGVAVEAVRCIGAGCRLAIKVVKDRRTRLSLLALALSIKLAANHVDNTGAQMAAEHAVKEYLHILPRAQKSPEVKEYLVDMAKDVINLMNKYNISGEKDTIAVANLFERKVGENPKTNKKAFRAAVLAAGLGARIPF